MCRCHAKCRIQCCRMNVMLTIRSMFCAINGTLRLWPRRTKIRLRWSGMHCNKQEVDLVRRAAGIIIICKCTYRIKVGVSPLNKHLHPSVLIMFLVTCKVEGIFSPGPRLMPCILVFIVSNGKVASQEAVPAQPPAIINSLHDNSSSSFSASSIRDSW